MQVEAERVAGVSDEDGSFEVRGLAAGSWRPFVRDEGWCGEVATSVVLGPGETSERVTIAARRCPVVQGEVVVMGSGAGCGAAQVELLDAVGDVTRRVLADAGGQVALSGVEPGAYAVRVRCPGHLQRAPAPLWVGDTGVRARWEVEAGRTVRGRVVDANGVVVPRARVEVVGPLGVVVAEADDAGNFVVKGVSPGASRVRPYHPQQGEGEALEQEIAEELDPPPMQLKFAASATIRGQVRALGGPLPANLTVVARALTGRGGKAVRVGEDGRYAVSGVTRGPHRVVVQRAPELVAAKVAGELVAAVEVDLRAGDVGAVDFEVVAARLVALTGRVEDENGGGEAGAVVTVSDTRIRERAQTDESGRFAVLVEEGATYTVTAMNRAGAELVAVDVAPGAELVLKAAGISGSSGRATRRGGPRK